MFATRTCETKPLEGTCVKNHFIVFKKLHVALTSEPNSSETEYTHYSSHVFPMAILSTFQRKSMFVETAL